MCLTSLGRVGWNAMASKVSLDHSLCRAPKALDTCFRCLISCHFVLPSCTMPQSPDDASLDSGRLVRIKVGVYRPMCVFQWKPEVWAFVPSCLVVHQVSQAILTSVSSNVRVLPFPNPFSNEEPGQTLKSMLSCNCNVYAYIRRRFRFKARVKRCEHHGADH